MWLRVLIFQSWHRRGYIMCRQKWASACQDVKAEFYLRYLPFSLMLSHVCCHHLYCHATLPTVSHNTAERRPRKRLPYTLQHYWHTPKKHTNKHFQEAISNKVKFSRSCQVCAFRGPWHSLTRELKAGPVKVPRGTTFLMFLELLFALRWGHNGWGLWGG